MNMTSNPAHITAEPTTTNEFKSHADFVHEVQVKALDHKTDLIIKGIGRAIAIGVYLAIACVIFAILFYVVWCIGTGVIQEVSK